MAVDTVAPPRSREQLFIVFLDITAFTRSTRGRPDDSVADALDACYRLWAEATTASGGRVVKFTGDGALLCWPVGRADHAVRALLDLREATARELSAAGIHGSLLVRAHAGEAVA